MLQEILTKIDSFSIFFTQIHEFIFWIFSFSNTTFARGSILSGWKNLRNHCSFIHFRRLFQLLIYGSQEDIGRVDSVGSSREYWNSSHVSSSGFALQQTRSTLHDTEQRRSNESEENTSFTNTTQFLTISDFITH